jgi:hypothetical protein
MYSTSSAAYQPPFRAKQERDGYAPGSLAGRPLEAGRKRIEVSEFHLDVMPHPMAGSGPRRQTVGPHTAAERSRKHHLPCAGNEPNNGESGTPTGFGRALPQF